MNLFQSLTAKIATAAKEKKSLTAKAAVAARGSLNKIKPESEALRHRQGGNGYGKGVRRPVILLACNGGVRRYRSRRHYLPWRCLGGLGLEFIIDFFACFAVRLSRAFLRVLGVLGGEALQLRIAQSASQSS